MFIALNMNSKINESRVAMLCSETDCTNKLNSLALKNVIKNAYEINQLNYHNIKKNLFDERERVLNKRKHTTLITRIMAQAYSSTRCSKAVGR